MNKFLKVFIGIVASVVAIIIVIFSISYWMLNRTVPEYDGETNSESLKSSITVYRDSSAIPLIVALNDEDAAFGIGYVHAQDRLFQMDVARRAGEGRLSEIFGTSTLSFDKMFKTIGIYNNVKNNYDRLNPLTKKILKSYADGVNHFIKENKGKYQPEFGILGYEPYNWKPEHSLVIGKLLGWELNISWWTDVAFSAIIQKIGEEKARQLLPDFPQNAPTIIPSEFKNIATIKTEIINTDRKFREFTGFIGTHIGSNNWVVNNSMSSSAKPIVANDPHLAFSAPGKWFFIMVSSPTWKVEGFSLPGIPAVIIGKNQNISWVVTNVMADDADFYAEQIDTSGTKYLIDGNWRNLKSRKEIIKVKNGGDELLDIRENHRGPLITDSHPYNVLYPGSKNNAALSMRWTGLEFSDDLFSLLMINKASNWEEFKLALSHFTVPGQNFVYGDNKNNIGYICASKLPVRSNASPTLVYNGTTSSNDWKGFVPYGEMPILFNPAQNFIASANNKTLKNFPHHISNLWEPSSRIERITQLLSSKSKHNVKDFKTYQNDLISPYSQKIIGFIKPAFQNVRINDNNLRDVIKLLDSWNYEMNSGSQLPAIYNVFLKFLIKNIFEDELGKELFSQYVFVANVPYRKLLEILEANSSTFLDNINTAEIETRDEIIRNSLSEATTYLEKHFGKNIADWQWGNLHTVTFKHMFSGKSDFLDKIINIGPYPIGGDGTTIFNTEYSFRYLSNSDDEIPVTTKFENILGPSMRYIYDFGDPEIIHFILPTGQSGNFMSSHYSDMTDKWRKGKYIKLDINENRFIQKSKSKITITAN
ncbi:MAG: penicillin acylase family protein [Melioribacteraceae bacterium]|nr:penicillin acylase family protein [Melioribacteraceae bacterium]